MQVARGGHASPGKVPLGLNLGLGVRSEAAGRVRSSSDPPGEGVGNVGGDKKQGSNGLQGWESCAALTFHHPRRGLQPGPRGWEVVEMMHTPSLAYL